MGVFALLRPSASALFASHRSALTHVRPFRPPAESFGSAGGLVAGWSGVSCRTVSCVLRRVRTALKRQSCDLIRLSVTQFEFLLIQRVKSSIQIFQLYSSLYEREALVDAMRRVVHALLVRGRQTVLAAALLMAAAPSDRSSQCQSAGDAGQSGAASGAEPVSKDQSERSCTDGARLGYGEDFGEFDRLRLNTIHCSQCGQRLVIDKKVAGVSYCSCERGASSAATTDSDDGWAPFLEAPNIVVWRRQHEDPEQSHLYAYRVYGTFSDVTADAFCEVQLNTELRDSWDDSVQEIYTVTSPDNSATSPDRTDVIYWVVRFPRMFSNRDYVFERQCWRDPVSGQVTVVSRSVSHAQCPPRAGLVRVADYWSVMLVRPHSSSDQPGMDFGLTYFDNPGTQLPSFVTNYVAASGMPEFLDKVAEAARRIQHEVAVGSLSVPLHFIQPGGDDRQHECGPCRPAEKSPPPGGTTVERAESLAETRSDHCSSAQVAGNSPRHVTRSRIPAVG